MPERTTWRPSLGTVAIAAGVVGVIAAAVELRTGVELAASGATAVSAAVETAQLVVALVVTFLLLGRARRSNRVGDVLLVMALAAQAASNAIGVAALVTAPDDGSLGAVWARLSVRVAGAALLAAAALWSGPLVDAAWRWRIRITGAAVVAVAVVLATIDERLPEAVHPGEHVPVGTRVVFASIALLTGVAALGFHRRARDTGDPLLAALTVAYVLGATSWLAFMGRSTLFTDDVHLGDVLRFCSWLVLLAGAALEVRGHWLAERQLAVVEERRRLARDLHDGLAQELGFILQGVRQLRTGSAPPDVEAQIESAAGRALDESRRAIAALRNDTDGPLAHLLGRTASTVAARHGMTADVVVTDAVDLSGADREQLVRIVAEAIRNAARHGEAHRVTVRLGADRVLRIDDDGRGLPEGGAPANGRFGLTTMRERASAIGATLSVRPGVERGTTVEVRLP